MSPDPYLYAHQNPHAPVRANARRFWGYPTRKGGVRPRLIGVHTTESILDAIGEDSGAEAVARYQSTVERPSSYHRIVDRDSTVVMLPDDAVAFGIIGLNTPALHLSIAMRATDWSDPAKARAAQPALERGARVAAEWSHHWGIPVRRLDKDQAFGGASGLIAHGDADPTRRSDPGADFPWATFLHLVATGLPKASRSRDPKATHKRPTPLVVLGDTGNAVREIQTRLGLKGRAVDGAFGPNTEAAVIRFQRAHRLAPDGQVGPRTWAALRRTTP